MRNDIDKRRKKRGPIAAAIVAVLFLAFYFGAPLSVLPILRAEGVPMRIFSAPLLIAAAVSAAAVVGIVIALVQRLREIDRGEEDEARKY